MYRAVDDAGSPLIHALIDLLRGREAFPLIYGGSNHLFSDMKW